jgi:regulatory protein
VRSDAPPPDPADDEPPADPEAVARRICLQQLDRRARSRAELAAVLRRRGVPDDAANRVLDRFAEVGLVDDAALAELVAGAQHRERGLARRAVAAKLRQRGFDDEAVGAALTGINADDERARARQLVARRLRALAGLPPEVQARRLVALLARKGYPSGLAYEVVRAELAAHADARLVDALSGAGDPDNGLGDEPGG